MVNQLHDHQVNNLVGFDCFSQVIFKSVEDYKRMKEDPWYKVNLVGDHENFADTKRSMMTIGWVSGFVRDGHVVNGFSPDGASAAAAICQTGLASKPPCTLRGRKRAATSGTSSTLVSKTKAREGLRKRKTVLAEYLDMSYKYIKSHCFGTCICYILDNMCCHAYKCTHRNPGAYLGTYSRGRTRTLKST